MATKKTNSTKKTPKPAIARFRRRLPNCPPDKELRQRFLRRAGASPFADTVTTPASCRRLRRGVPKSTRGCCGRFLPRPPGRCSGGLGGRSGKGREWAGCNERGGSRCWRRWSRCPPPTNCARSCQTTTSAFDTPKLPISSASGRGLSIVVSRMGKPAEGTSGPFFCFRGIRTVRVPSCGWIALRYNSRFSILPTFVCKGAPLCPMSPPF
jgi:hypothetical protein